MNDDDDLFDFLDDQIAAQPVISQPVKPSKKVKGSPKRRPPGSSPISDNYYSIPLPVTTPREKNTYDDFFDNIAKYLLDDPDVSFQSEHDKKALHIALQSVERLNNEQAIDVILRKYGLEEDDDKELYEKLSDIKESYKDDLLPEQLTLMDDWIANKRDSISSLYKSSSKQVNNRSIREQSRHMEGYLKRLNTPIPRSKAVDKAKFDRLYEVFKEEEVPVYAYLYFHPQDNPTQAFKAIKQQNILDLAFRSDKYIQSIIADYYLRKPQYDQMLEGFDDENDVMRNLDRVAFQINDNKERYLWMSQHFTRAGMFDTKTAKEARIGDKKIDKSGQLYSARIKTINDNVKSFITGGDDKIWDQWYRDHDRYDRYKQLKTEWNAFVRDKEILLRFDMRDPILYIDDFGGTKEVGFSNIEDFLRMETRDMDILPVQKKLREIYDADLDIYTSVLSGSTAGIFQFRSRYGVMMATKEDIIRKLPPMSHDVKTTIINGIDFLGYSQKHSPRSRTNRPGTKKNLIDITIDGKRSPKKTKK
jgi:hypothetical protein